MYKLDLKDRRILAALDMNARMPIGELANQVGVSRQVASYRINQLQKEGVVIGAVTIFDSVVAGFGWFRVLMRLNGTSKKDEAVKFLSNHPHTLWVGEVGGNWDIVVNFIAKDTYKFNSILEEFLGKYGNDVAAYESLVYVHVLDQPRAYLLEDKTDKRGQTTEPLEFDHTMRYNPEITLDKTDKDMINELTRDAFTPNYRIAAKIGVSDKTVLARIKRMEQNGLILGYRLAVHPSSIGYESYMIFLGIHNLQSERENELQKFVRSMPNVTYIVKHIGRWRIGIEVEVKNRIEFQNILVSIRDRFGDIISEFETFPIFKDHAINYFPPGNLSIE